MNNIAFDFETYYDKKHFSIDSEGLEGYVWHQDFDAYLVAVHGNGISYIGSPKDFDWTLMHGQRWIAHNAGFEEAVVERLRADGVIPDSVQPGEVVDTADLAAFLGYPRNLKTAAHCLLGVEMQKTTRDNMSGKRWESMTPEFKKEVMEYALKDAVTTLEIWEKFSDQWPEEERWLSWHTREIGKKGIPVDSERLEEGIQHLYRYCAELKSKIPWAANEDSEGVPLSRKEMAIYCREQGVPVPLSTDKKDPDFIKWMEDYSEKCPAVAAMRDFRGANAMLKKLLNMRKVTRDNGRMRFNLMYFGAGITGRWSGGGGSLNIQNLTKGEMYGVDIRSLFTAPKGYTFVVADLANIEIRTCYAVAKDNAMLDKIRVTDDIYEAIAREWNLYNKDGALKKTDPGLRHIVKGCFLGAQFGMSGDTFARNTGTPRDEANKLIDMFREKNPAITSLWKKLQQAALRAAGGSLELRLPSGRMLRYRDVRLDGRQTTAMMPRGSNHIRMKFWHGTMIENLAQASAREILAHCIRKLEDKGIEVLFHVHDEIVVLAKVEEADKVKATMEEVMTTPPDWWKALPLGVEAKLMTKYEK